jgi:tetratricopeptide (TPR) repeat protein
MEIDKPEPKIPMLDGGTAILALGIFLQEKGWIDDAMYFFRHGLYLFMLEVNVDEPSLLDEAEDCDGLFYSDIATAGSQEYSPAHELIGTILIKMGDVHGKNLEINEAMRAYRASQVFWDAYLTGHKASIQEQGKDNVDDLDLLNDYAAAVEGLALAHNRVGGVFTSKGDLSAAMKSFEEAVNLQIDALGDDHLEVGKTLHNIGVCYRHDDEWDQALQYYERAYAIFEKKLGKNNLDTARTMHNIGGVYRRKRMYDEAINSFKEVLRVRRKLLGDDHPSVSLVLISIAAVLRRCGRKEEANMFYAAAIR